MFHVKHSALGFIPRAESVTCSEGHHRLSGGLISSAWLEKNQSQERENRFIGGRVAIVGGASDYYFGSCRFRRSGNTRIAAPC